MMLRFKDRTWILLGKLIDKGLKEGVIRHIEMDLKDWHRLVAEWEGLGEADRKSYMRSFKVNTEDGIPLISPEPIIMAETFVDKWVASEYDVYYRDVKLVPEVPKVTVAQEEDKSVAETEKLG